MTGETVLISVALAGAVVSLCFTLASVRAARRSWRDARPTIAVAIATVFLCIALSSKFVLPPGPTDTSVVYGSVIASVLFSVLSVVEQIRGKRLADA